MQAADTKREQPHALLRSAFDAIHDSVIILDLDYNVVFANRSCENFLPLHQPVIGEKCYRLFHGLTAPCDNCPYEAALATGVSGRCEFSFNLEDGRTGWYEILVSRLDDQDGNPIGAVEHSRDITPRKRATEQLRDEIARRRLLVGQSRDGIVVLDQLGAVCEANEAFAKMLGYTLDEVYQLSVFDWEVAFPTKVVLEMLSRVDGKGDQLETRHKRKDGSFVDVEMSTNGAVYGDRKLIFCVCRDVTERNELMRRVEKLAIRDDLTEIYNRRYLFERLSEIVAWHSREGTPFCVSMLDIDHFKSINDAYGHQAGDFVLKEFSRLVRSMIRPYDLLGRYGGEEFMIISKNKRARETHIIIERILAAVRETSFVFGGQAIQLTVSCGLMESAEFSRGELSVEEAVALADERLYKAKTSGRDRIVGPIAGVPLRTPTLVARRWRLGEERLRLDAKVMRV